MAKRNEKNPLTDDEMLKNAGADPESRHLEDPVEAEIAEENDIQTDEEDAEQRIVSLENELSQLDDRYKRTAAEFINYRKRQDRERLTLIDTAGKKIMSSLLPVLDDFERAYKTASANEESAEVWNSGVGLVVKKLMDTLANQGLKPMDSDGKDFDPDFHEAITEIDSPNMKGKVVDTIERGYTLNDNIIRHAKVVVGR